MPGNKLYNPGQPSLAQRLNHASRTRQAGYSKTNREEVLLFKRRIADGMDPEEARKGTKISKRMVPDILAGRTWASVILLVLIATVTMGNSCVAGNDYTVTCQGINYPLCRDVPYDYPCLCLSAPDGVTSQRAQELRYLNDR